MSEEKLSEEVIPNNTEKEGQEEKLNTHPKKKKRPYILTEKRKAAFEKCRARRQEELRKREQLSAEEKERKRLDRQQFKKAWMSEKKRKIGATVADLEEQVFEEEKPPASATRCKTENEMEVVPSRRDEIAELHAMIGELYDSQQELKNQLRADPKSVMKKSREEEPVYDFPSSMEDSFVYV